MTKFIEITDVSEEELFEKFVAMSPEKRINLVSAYCLSRALSKTSGLKEDPRLEYLKEYGRNERTVLKSETGGSSDNEDPIFPRSSLDDGSGEDNKGDDTQEEL